jgi:uncharacterized damage-inducible protein DinB
MAIAQQEKALTTILIGRWEQASRKISELAEVLPADKFESRPVAGTRTFGEVLRHVAFWNQYVADSLRGKEADDTTNELPFASYPTKASVLEALKRGSEDAASALRERQALLDLKAAELVMTFIEHTSEHYGQMVVHVRLMGIVPPASRT